MHGSDADDILEGNYGNDWRFGEAGEDDMYGGMLRSYRGKE